MVEATTRFQRALVDGAELEYEVAGSGEPVLFIHGAVIGDAFGMLLSQPSLAGYRLVNYHRRGYNGSSRPAGRLSIERQALDAIAIMDAAGIERAYVVGHSIGGSIALALADAAPDRVHSLALLEPGPISSAAAADEIAALEPIAEMYRSGELAAAIDAFCQAVAGPEYREAVRGAPPNWFEQAVADVDTLFQVELPSALEWDFTADMARRIHQPVLSVLGSRSAEIDAGIAEVHAWLQAYIPQTEACVIPDVTHALQLMNPSAVADALANFFAHHPMPRKL